MYALFVYLQGAWRHITNDSHEEHAAMFIDKVERELGEGHAYVVKLPSDPIEVSVKGFDWDEEAKQLFGNH